METSAFQSFKLAVMSATDLSRDALHVHAGLAVFVLVALAFRRPLRSPLPWLAVLVVALLVEVVDLREDLSFYGRYRWGASAHDIVNTLAWPTLLMLLSRLSGRRRIDGAARSDGDNP